MKHMFAQSLWSTPQNQGVQGMGFRPGPVQVQVQPSPLRRPIGLSGSQVAGRILPLRSEQPKAMEGDCADGHCEVRPSSVRPPGIQVAPKGADCPVCRSFGGGKGRF
jgi:hypothetical protein